MNMHDQSIVRDSCIGLLVEAKLSKKHMMTVTQQKLDLGRNSFRSSNAKKLKFFKTKTQLLTANSLFTRNA